MQRLGGAGAVRRRATTDALRFDRAAGRHRRATGDPCSLVHVCGTDLWRDVDGPIPHGRWLYTIRTRYWARTITGSPYCWTQH